MRLIERAVATLKEALTEEAIACNSQPSAWVALPMPMREARARFFAEHAGLFGSDGGYDKKWIRLEMGPLPIYIPNTKGRMRAVQLHDLHHIATEYDPSVP